MVTTGAAGPDRGVTDVNQIAVPSSMNDTPMSSDADDATVAERTATMIDRADRAVVRDQAFGPTTVVFIIVLVIDLVLAVLCLAAAGFALVSGAVAGAVIAGLFLTQVQAIVSLYISPVWSDPIVFGIMVIMLMVRPQGLFGRLGHG